MNQKVPRKVYAFLQARMSSSRFPGKTLHPVLGKPLLAWAIERLKFSKKIDLLSVVTSSDPSDEELSRWCEREKISVFQGDLENVLSRFVEAGKKFIPKSEWDSAIVLRLTGDCPFLDVSWIDEGIGLFKKESEQGLRYLGYDPDLPDGLDFEVMDFSALLEANDESDDPFEKEHVTPFLWRRGERFGAKKFSRKQSYQKGLRFSVDYPNDLRFTEALLLAQEKSGKSWGADELADYVAKHPELKEIQGETVNNEGLIRSKLQSPSFLTEWNGKKVPKIALVFEKGISEAERKKSLEWAIKVGVQVSDPDASWMNGERISLNVTSFSQLTRDLMQICREGKKI